MNDQLDREVAAALDRLGNGGPPPLPAVLAASAVRRAARGRRVRVGVLVAMLVVAGAVVTVAAAPGEPPPTVAAGPRQRVVAAVTCASWEMFSMGWSAVLNPSTGRYSTAHYCVDSISPDGRRATVSQQPARFDAGMPPPTRYGVLTLETGRIRWFANWTAPGYWSPDGTRILMGLIPGPPPSFGAQVADPDTGQTRFVQLPAVDNFAGAQPVWLTDDEFALSPCSCAYKPRIPVFDLRGQLLRYVPVAGRQGLFTQQLVSPGGQLAALTAKPTGEGLVQVVAMGGPTPGRVVARIPLRGSSFVLGWYDASHLVVAADADAYRESGELHLQVYDLSGNAVRVAVLQPVQGGRARGSTGLLLGPLTPASRQLGF